MTEREVREVKNIQKIYNYAKSHISVPVTAMVMVLLLVVGLILQFYVKNKYFAYLMKETVNMEEAVMDASASNLNDSLSDIVNTSCRIAIDNQLYTLVDAAMQQEKQQARNMIALKQELHSIAYYAENIAVATIVTENGKLLEYGRYWAGGAYPQLWTGEKMDILDELYKKVQNSISGQENIRYFAATYPDHHPSMANMSLFHVAVPLLGKNYTWPNARNVVVITYVLDHVFETSKSLNTGQKHVASAYLADADNMIIFHEKNEYVGKDTEEYHQNEPGMKVIEQELDYFGWKVYIAIDIEEMRSEVDHLYHRSIVVYMVLLLLCGLFWNISIRSILRPIGEIRGAMEKLELNRNLTKVQVRGTHELWQLASHYNEMVDELEEQQREIERYYKEKTRSMEQKNRAEMEALAAQINSHFLCNTLTEINYDAAENGDEEVALLLTRLSHMLSYTFSKKLVNVTIRQEIDWVEQYLYLQKFRLMDVFDYEISYPEEYGEWPCCKLFLQPFIENSIIHGFEGREQGGNIRIDGEISDQWLKLRVRDNGCGMKKEAYDAIQKIVKEKHPLELNGTGIGIRNAVSRLRIYYGENLNIEMESEEGKGTEFTFWLPIPKQMEGEDVYENHCC